ncbi:Os03g0674951 [Oryza sativa Japonica Group]|uniref:Os03g0674951 protein n=1 Tax=Oryza sativa subsp. japonica TaxID=39947 RepID=A0A0N7KHT5_ORYSJ|nr:Os03g0674951 [Oryza sativa Japonica Group]
MVVPLLGTNSMTTQLLGTRVSKTMLSYLPVVSVTLSRPTMSICLFLLAAVGPSLAVYPSTRFTPNYIVVLDFSVGTDGLGQGCFFRRFGEQGNILLLAGVGSDREEAKYWLLRRASSASQSICLPWVEAAVAIAETLLDLSSFLSFCVVML